MYSRLGPASVAARWFICSSASLRMWSSLKGCNTNTECFAASPKTDSNDIEHLVVDIASQNKLLGCRGPLRTPACSSDCRKIWSLLKGLPGLWVRVSVRARFWAPKTGMANEMASTSKHGYCQATSMEAPRRHDSRQGIVWRCCVTYTVCAWQSFLFRNLGLRHWRLIAPIFELLSPSFYSRAVLDRSNGRTRLLP